MNWKRQFKVGEVLELKALKFRVAHIGKRGVVFHPVPQPTTTPAEKKAPS